MPAQIHVNQGKARVVIPSRGGIAAIGGSQVPSAFGEDGREVQLQKSATHIQWRYEGDAAWTNLVALSELQGDPGAQGETGPMPYDYRGAWDGFTSYGLYDAVTYQGSLYWLPATGGWTIGGAPPAYNWELLVSKGDTGEQGETGKSAYQSYLDTTADDPVLTEEQWSEGGGGGGDYLPLAGGTMDANASIIWGNASAIREAGAQGLEIECSVGYRWQWVAGRMILRQINSGQIQRVLAIDGVTPGDTEDISEGFIVGTRWETQDGTIYECTDSTDGAAVWENVTLIPISTPGIAHVNSGGDDSTGAIGDPSKPYLTAQAAWDDGARVFEFGAGSFSFSHTENTGGTSNVFVRGLGRANTSLAITWTGTTGATGNDPAGTGGTGGTPTDLFLSSDKSVALSLTISGGTGGVGGAGTAGDGETSSGVGGSGGSGGNAPSFTLYGCHVTALSYAAGIGGAGGQPGTDNGGGLGSVGAAGSDGNLAGDAYYWCVLPTGYSANTPGARYACMLDDVFYADIPASEVSYAATSVDAALTSLASRAVIEHYMRDTDFFNSSGSIGDVTGLSCSVAANEKLLIEIVGFRVGGAALSGLQIAFNGPSTPTHVRYTLEHWNAVATARTVAAATAFNTTLLQVDGSTDALPFRATLTLINGSNPGTVQFRAASENSGTSITFLKGMTMKVSRIP